MNRGAQLTGPQPFLADPELLVFDLDGTLLDTLEGITTSANTVRERHGLPPLPEEAVRHAIGDGARILVQRTMPEILADETALDHLFEEFRAVYIEESIRDPRFYPGAREFLERVEPHQTLAVLTNKPLAISEAMLSTLGVTDLFVRVLAPENVRARKPDPAGLQDLLGELEVFPGDAVMIGDSTKDFACGRGAGVPTIGMRDGYGVPGDPAPDYWAEDFDQLRRWWDVARAQPEAGDPSRSDDPLSS